MSRVRITEKEAKFLQAMAAFYDMPVFSLLKEKSLPELEDTYDTLDGEDAYMDFMKSKKPTYSLDEARVKLGLKPRYTTVNQVKSALTKRFR